MVVDVVVHDHGVVTEWAMGDCVGDHVTVTAAKGSLALPEDASWVYLVGDLTALPAMARTREALAGRLPVSVWAEAGSPIPGYFRDDIDGDVTWTRPADDGTSGLAALVTTLPWPGRPGYFWMAGESAQMRAIRTHLMRVLGLAHSAYDVMGYWRAGHDARQARG